MWSIEKRLLVTESIILAVAVAGWGFFTDRGLDGLGTCLFRAGLGAIALGLLVIVGAWTGIRHTSIAYIRPDNRECIRRDRQYVKRAWSDLNVLAMAGAIAIAVGVLLS